MSFPLAACQGSGTLPVTCKCMMPATEESSSAVLFGPFELLLDTMELRKGGVPIKVTGQAIQVLAMLIARPGQLVTRSELQEKLWPGDSFGDFEHGLNAAVNRLRDKLGDSATAPRYIETLPGRGYRFVGKVEPPSGGPIETGKPTPRQAVSPFKYGRHVSLVLGLSVAAIGVMLVPGLRRTLLGVSGGTPTLPEQKQLAVLPFVALNEDKETGAFAKGLAETIASRLNRLTEKHSLQIISTRELAGSNVDSVPKARREFGVNLGLEGSVEQSGSMVRVSYHLIDAKTLRQLGADTITASGSNTFVLEDEVAESVAKALDLELQPNAKVGAATLNSRTEPSAYDFYLQGLGYLQDYIKPGNLDSAITVFQHAVALNDRYAPAHAGLGEAYWYRYQDTHNSQWVKDATEQCNRAVEYDGSDFRGHICLGTIFEGSGEYDKATQQFDRALKLEPTSDDAVRGLASAYDKRSEPVKAEETYQRAIALRPQYWLNYNMLGVFYYSRSRYNEAAKMFQEVIALTPDNYRGYSNLGGIYLLQGRYADAVPLFQRAIAIQPTADAYSNLGTTYFYLRKFSESATAFSQATKEDAQSFAVWGNLADAESRIPGKQEEAARDYRHAINLAEGELRVNPRDTRVLDELADYHSMTGNGPKAEEYIRRALVVGPHDSEVMFKAAEVYNQLGQTDTAANWLIEALDAGYSVTVARDAPTMDNLRSKPQVQARLFGQK